VGLRPGSPGEAGFRPERIELARERCAQWVKEDRTPSLAVCVARRGVVALHECWGVQGPGLGPLQRDSLFPLSSITKPVTATLALQLVEDGLLGLNRPAKEYLPELAGDHIEEVLVHHLLTHTAGYPGAPDPETMRLASERLAGGFEIPPCPENQHPKIHQLLSVLWDAPRVRRAGEAMEYGNRGYVLLAEILRRLSGRAIDDLARERIFAPLGMEDTFYVVPESEAPRVVQRPEHFPMAAGQPPWFPGIGSREHQELPLGAAGIFAAPGDMVRFGQMILNGGRTGGARILSPAAVAAMTRDQVPGIGAVLGPLVSGYASWGYGWAIESPQKWVYYNGSLIPLGTFCHPGGGGVMLWIDPVHEIVGAYFEVTKLISCFDLFSNLITAAVED
jgi:CubicO group peptidase (beta-lactamase class C family)